jgi:hypothetical protein
VEFAAIQNPEAVAQDSSGREPWDKRHGQWIGHERAAQIQRMPKEMFASLWMCAAAIPF